MDTVNGQAIGNVNVIVYETKNGEKFFQVKANNGDVSPIAYIIEDTLTKY